MNFPTKGVSPMFKNACSFVVFSVLCMTVPAQARVDRFLETPKKFTVMCKDGKKSSSKMSQRKAICGCAKSGGAVGFSTKTCARA
jgi:hypothetical protein